MRVPLPDGAKDIFTKTTRARASIAPDVTPRTKGRPQNIEPYQKVTVCLFDRHIVFLDKVTLAIRERGGKPIKRAELLRAIVDHISGTIQPDKPGFDRAIRSIMPGHE